MSEGCTRYRWSRRAVAAACVALLSGCGPAAGSVTGNVLASPLATGTDEVPSATDAVAGGAAAEPAIRGEVEGTLRGLAVAGGKIVVVGADDTGPAAWSMDGAGEWSAHTVAPGGGALRLDAAAYDGSVGVAFGARDAGGSQAWVTDESHVWRLHDTPGIDGRVGAVAFSDGRWIAVGDRVDPESGEAYEGVVWVSEDAAAFDVLAGGLALAEGTLSDVAVAGDMVVVVGFDVGGGAVWTSSADGAFEPGSGPFEAATIDGVTAMDEGFVALGRGLADQGLRAWASTDGKQWEAIDVSAEDLGPQDEIHDLTTVAGRVLAVGSTTEAGRVWTLRDRTLSPLGS